MKKLIFTLMAVCMLSLFARAQEEIPEAVLTAFNAKYPNAKNVEWVKSGDSQWQAEFVKKDHELEVVFDETGNWLGTNTEIDIKKLPDAVKKAIADKYKGYNVEEVEMVEILNGQTLYKVELENGDHEIETMFHADGRIVMRATDDEVEDREIEEIEEY